MANVGIAHNKHSLLFPLSVFNSVQLQHKTLKMSSKKYGKSLLSRRSQKSSDAEASKCVYRWESYEVMNYEFDLIWEAFLSNDDTCFIHC